MDTEVKIVLPKTKKKKAKTLPINPRIPQLPFFHLIVGPRHSGKTVLAHHLLSKESGMYGAAFKKQNKILYSPTYDFDDSFHDLKLTNVYNPPVDPSSVVEKVINIQMSHKDMDNFAPVIFVLDDITQIRDAWRILERLGYIGRHFEIHVMAIAHKMSSIPRGVRTQTQQWSLFKPHEQSEWQWVLDMFSMRQTKDIWITALRRCWAIPHNFVHIDLERKEFNEIYRSGFNEALFTPQAADTLQGMGTKSKIVEEWEQGKQILAEEKDDAKVHLN